MATVNVDWQQLQKHIGAEYANKLQEIMRTAQNAGTIVIANTGLVNSGKSSLFNAIMDKSETDAFPVGPIRTTKTGKAMEFARRVFLLDTPGIDASQEDDEEAYRTILHADIILIIHNIKLGMLHRSEFEWVSRLASELTQTDIRERVAFVCTWIDARDKDATYQKTVDESKRQIADALGTSSFASFEVSALRYVTGKKKGIEKLEELSGVPALRKYLLVTSNRLINQPLSIRRDKILRTCDETLEMLNEKRKTYSDQIARKRQMIDSKYKIQVQTWISVLDNFRAKRKRVEDTQERKRRLG